ncbi:MAG: hypothetical protein U1C70_14285 [Sediminibacterium sp.]|jgi:hypothetical protein|uniref:hypothetical protein n=1 Tax=Sediminibacterium sp. TaxID=1917865 RepID=UPI002AB831C2|nr:hypothetical protein [Sediminibacterium sp.]MDZ4072987.1 hypothetical protein [Sediminibacterium sp.]
MPDPFYPSVDLSFIEHHLVQTGKFAGHYIVGQTITFVLNGPQAIHKRSILIRQLTPGQVCYEQATGLAARFGFMGALLAWLDTNRNWREGAYVQ